MVDKLVSDIRKIVDKSTATSSVPPAPVLTPKSRGLASFIPSIVSFQNYEGVYSMVDIIDNINGPRLAVEVKDPRDHVAKITGINDPVFTDLAIILKPNGIFD